MKRNAMTSAERVGLLLLAVLLAVSLLLTLWVRRGTESAPEAAAAPAVQMVSTPTDTTSTATKPQKKRKQRAAATKRPAPTPRHPLDENF